MSNNNRRNLLQWLVLCGRDEVSYEDLMEKGVDDDMSMYDLEDEGLITINDKAPTYRYQLTDKAIKLLQQGENNEQ